MQIQSKTKGALLTISGGICWGLSGSMGQFLFTHENMDSRWLVPVRLGLAGLLLTGWCLLRNPKETIRPWQSRQDVIDLLIYGIAGVSMCQFLYFLTIQLSSAAIATILQDLSPVMILAVGCIKARRFPRPIEILSIVLALFGVFLLCTHGDPNHLAIPSSALLTGVLSAVCVTIYNVQPERLLRTYPVSVLQGWAFVLGSLFFCFVFQPWRYYVPLRVWGIIGIAFVVLVGNVLAFTCYMRGVSLIGPQKAILYGFAEPLTAAVITVYFFHQPFTVYDLLGFLLIFATLVLISLPDQKSAESR